MIIVYYNPRKPTFKQYGFHVYKIGYLLETENSKEDFPTRERAREEAVRYNQTLPFPHEVQG